MRAYKELVQAIISIANEQDFNEVCGKINRAFESEKISWKDHEQLFELVSVVGHGKGIN